MTVHARVETLGGLSAHADQKELLRWMRALPRPGRIALHHGEVEAQAGLQRAGDSVRS